MALDDLFSTQTALVAGVTAAICSPKTRETLRRGAVVGVAGAMRAGDVVVGAAKGAARGVRGQQSTSGSSNGSKRSPSRARSSSSSSRRAPTSRR